MTGTRGHKRWFLLAAAAAVFAFVWTPAASAQALVPSSPAVDQYSEEVPGPGGGNASGGAGGTGGQSTPLSPSAAAGLENGGGPNAALLERLATQAPYGAPQERLNGAEGAGTGPRSPLSAAVSAVTDKDTGGRLLGLLLAMAVIGVAALALGASRYRQGRA